MAYRKLAIKDFDGVRLPAPAMSGLDLLAIIAERALKIYDEEEAAPELNKRKQKAVAEELPEKRRRLVRGPLPLPPLPENFKTIISFFCGREVSFILHKRLYATDLCRKQNRLSIPINQIKTQGFLRDFEVEFLKGRKGKNMNRLKVHIIDPNLNKTWAHFVRWDMKKSNGNVSTSYAIITTWGRILQEYEFKIGRIMHIWAFRVEECLGFALAVVPED